MTLATENIMHWTTAHFFARFGTPLVKVEVMASGREFALYTQEKMAFKAWRANNDGKVPSSSDLAKIRENAKAKVNLMEIEQSITDFDKITRRQFDIPVQYREYINGGRGALSSARRHQFMEALDRGLLRVTSMECMDAVEEGRWDDVFTLMGDDFEKSREYARQQRARRLHASMRRAVIPAGYGGVNLFSIWTDITTIRTAMSGVTKAQDTGVRVASAYARLVTGVSGLISSLCSLAESVVKTVYFRARWGRAVVEKWQKKLRFGKYLGSAASAVMAFMDIEKAVDQWQKGHKGMMFVYGLSALVGTTTAVTIFSTAAATAIAAFFGITTLFLGVILFVLALALTVVIMLFADNEFQDWLEQCWFGTGTKKFKTLEEEHQEFLGVTS